MKKLYSLFAVAAMSLAVNAQTTVTYTFSGVNASEVLAGSVDANVSFVTDKGASAQSPTFYSAAPAGVRIYSDRNTGNGNSFIFTAAEGFEITALTFTAAAANYAPEVTYTFDGSTAAAMPKTGETYTVAGLSATTLSFKNAHQGGSANTQLRIPSFTITYRPATTMAVVDANATKINLVKNTSVSNELIFGAKSDDVKVLNLNGQVVKSLSASENGRVNVSSLPKGVYIVTGTVNGKAVSQKIIKK